MKKLLILFVLLLTGCGGIEATKSSIDSTTLGDVVTINSEEELRNMEMDGNYALGGNIELTSAWVPLGDLDSPFVGVLDGKGFTISGFSVNAPKESIDQGNGSLDAYASLIGYSKGTVKNLTVSFVLDKAYQITSSLIELKLYSGIVGVNKGVIDNVHAEGSIKISINGFKLRTGFIAGWNSGSITNSSSSGTISTTATLTNRVGGIAGANEDGTITSVNSSVTINCLSKNEKACAGGIVGINENGNINIAASNSQVTVVGEKKGAHAGGIVGIMDGGNVTNCYSLGRASAECMDLKAAYAGGVIGYIGDANNSNIVEYVISNVSVSAKSQKNSYAGLFTSRVEFIGLGSITNSFKNIIVSGGLESQGEGNSYLGDFCGSLDTLATIQVFYMGDLPQLALIKGTKILSISESNISFDSSIWVNGRIEL